MNFVNKNPITHRWVDVAKHGSGLLRYYEYYRHIIKIFPIEILRDPFDASHGLWLVGETDIVNDVEELITTLIDLCEKYAKTHDNKKDHKVHGHKIKGDAKDVCLMKQLTKQQDEVREDLRELMNIAQEHEKLRYEYIAQTSLLYKLKPFRRAKS